MCLYIIHIVDTLFLNAFFYFNLDQIAQFVPNFNRHHLQLRGLVNRGNWCYINTTLQALLGISAITHFYKSLRSFLNTKAKSTSTPLTDSM